MNMDSIQALLEALKRSEGKADTPDDDEGTPIAAKLSVVKAKPIGAGSSTPPDLSDMADHGFGKDIDQLPNDMNDHVTDDDGDDDAGQDNERNAMMVDILQEQFPQIYAKIDKMIGSDQDQDQGDLSDTTAPSAMS